MLDITISGGTVVTPSGARAMDVHISGHTITAVTLPGTEGFEAGRTIDAGGMIVIPGGVEPHAHIGGSRQPERSGAEDVSKAAIFGGTTTVLDFATRSASHSSSLCSVLPAWLSFSFLAVGASRVPMNAFAPRSRQPKWRRTRDVK